MSLWTLNLSLRKAPQPPYYCADWFVSTVLIVTIIMIMMMMMMIIILIMMMMFIIMRTILPIPL